MREESNTAISNCLDKFNKYSREEYSDLEYKRVDKYKSKKMLSV